MSRALGRALGTVVSPIVDYVDVDGIARRIDVNDLMNRVDVDAVFERIDVNAVLDRVDIDRLLDRVDVNRVVARVDVNELMDRAEIGALVARSTSGVLAPLLDGGRSQVVFIDQVVQGVGWIRKKGLPHAPGIPIEIDPPTLPQGASNIAVAVQGRYAGTASRVCAFVVDNIFLGLFWLIVAILVDQALILLGLPTLNYSDDGTVTTAALAYWVWGFIYHVSALTATGRTIGKSMVGLKVSQSKDGQPISSWTACVRTLLLPVSIVSIVGVAIGLIRKDRREFHDIVAKTCVVYSWDARLARYREETLEEEEEMQLLEERRRAIPPEMMLRRQGRHRRLFSSGALRAESSISST